VKELQGLLFSAFPFCSDLSTKSSDGFIPHLSLGQWPSRDAARQCSLVTASTLPLLTAFNCSSVALISRDGDAPFVIHYTIPFGRQEIVSTKIPYITENNSVSSSSASSARKRTQHPQKLYIGGLAPQVTEDELKRLFTSRGFEVQSVKLMLDAKGNPRSFAFVQLESDEAVQRAMGSGLDLGDGITVSLARKKK
jgi:hypothetical protein